VTDLMHTLTVELGERSYPIFIGSGILGERDFIAPYLAGRQAVVISNTTVAPLYLDRLRRALPGDTTVTEVILADGEQYKTLASLEEIFDRVLGAGHNRTTTFIALGGGVVGDIAGFAAACYQRGVRLLQVPTTLLSQVDSSVGGKTAVNHPLGKNMIGAFHQPAAVIIDIDTLQSLPRRQLSAGLAEVVKYGLICDAPFYTWFCDHVDRLLAREPAALAEAVERSCADKARVVVGDEREAGLRAVLNLGHTFGHAIEAEQGYGSWLHGEAVATGMLLALRLSAARGWIEQAEVERFTSLLQRMELPLEPPADMGAACFLQHMRRDKKVQDGRLRLILLAAIGSACIVDDVSDAELIALLDR